MQSLKLFSSSGCLMKKTFSSSKTLIFLNSQTRSFSVAVPTPTPATGPPITQVRLLEAIESSQQYSIECLTPHLTLLGRARERLNVNNAFDPRINEALECFYLMKEKQVLPKIQIDEFIRHMATLGLKPSIFTYNKDKLGAACVMFQIMKGDRLFPHNYSNNYFMFVICNEGRFEEASNLLPKMFELGLVPLGLTYDALIHECCWFEEGLDDAVAYKDEMISRGIEPSLVTYNLLIHAHFEVGDTWGAEDMIVEMEERGMKPDVYTYNTMISGYFKCNTITTLLYDEMVEKRIQSTVLTYNTMMLMNCMDDEMKEAQKLFDEMKTTRGIKPDHISYNLLIGGYSRGCDVKECFRIHDEMLKNEFDPTITTYEPLIIGLCRIRKVEHAEDLLKEMGSEGICTPNDQHYLSLSFVVRTEKEMLMSELVHIFILLKLSKHV